MNIGIGSILINRIPVGPVQVLTVQQYDPSFKKYLVIAEPVMSPSAEDDSSMYVIDCVVFSSACHA